MQRKRTMTTRHHDIVAALLIAFGAAVSSHAATTYTYTYNYNFTVNSGCTGAWYASCGLTGTRTASSASPTPAPADPNAPATTIGASASGWANTDGTTTTYANQTLQKGDVQAWTSSDSGFSRTGMGVRNLDWTTGASGSDIDASESNSPEHAVDNNERYDSILYSFNRAVSLTQVQLSWYSNDSDISVLAFTGASFNEATNLAGLRYDQLLTNGWTLVGHYHNLHTSSYQAAISTGISSSYWLIGAANPLVGGSVADTTTDNVKIAALAATVKTQFTPPPPPTGVPEPGTLALFGLGALMLARTRARRA